MKRTESADDGGDDRAPEPVLAKMNEKERKSVKNIRGQKVKGGVAYFRNVKTWLPYPTMAVRSRGPRSRAGLIA